eukprot:g15669.t1
MSSSSKELNDGPKVLTNSSIPAPGKDATPDNSDTKTASKKSRRRTLMGALSPKPIARRTESTSEENMAQSVSTPISPRSFFSKTPTETSPQKTRTPKGSGSSTPLQLSPRSQGKSSSNGPPQKPSKPLTEQEQTLLRLATMGKDEELKAFLDSNEISIETSTQKGETSLIIAADQGHLALAKLLIDRKADLNAKDEAGITPLIKATFKGHTDVARLLLERGAEIDAKKKNGTTALITAADKNRTELGLLFIEKGAAPNAKNFYGYNSLILCALENNMQLGSALLDHKAMTDSRDREGNTPLLKAAEVGHTWFGKLLLERHADINTRNKAGNTAMHKAVDRGHGEFLQMLLAERPNLDLQNREMQTVVHKAVDKNKPEILQMLLAARANPDLQEKKGDTALMMTVEQGNVKLCNMLLDANADPNLANTDGVNPLLLSVETENVQLTKMLVEAKANMAITNKNGHTALQLALMKTPPAMLVAEILAVEAGVEAAHTDYDKPMTSIMALLDAEVQGSRIPGLITLAIQQALRTKEAMVRKEFTTDSAPSNPADIEASVKAKELAIKNLESKLVVLKRDLTRLYRQKVLLESGPRDSKEEVKATAHANNSIRSIDLRNNSIGDEGAKAINLALPLFVASNEASELQPEITQDWPTRSPGRKGLDRMATSDRGTRGNGLDRLATSDRGTRGNSGNIDKAESSSPDSSMRGKKRKRRVLSKTSLAPGLDRIVRMYHQFHLSRKRRVLSKTSLAPGLDRIVRMYHQFHLSRKRRVLLSKMTLASGLDPIVRNLRAHQVPGAPSSTSPTNHLLASVNEHELTVKHQSHPAPLWQIIVNARAVCNQARTAELVGAPVFSQHGERMSKSASGKKLMDYPQALAVDLADKRASIKEEEAEE